MSTEEPTNPNQPLSSYEDLRGSARGEAGELCKAADREEANLGKYYEQLQDDPRFTEEYRADLAWNRYNKAKEKIVEGRTKAGEQLASDATIYHRQSLPFPAGEGPITNDSSKILITQNEAQRISRKLTRLQESAGAAGRFRPDITSSLREEYERGLEVGGTMGGALCRAVLSVADEYGVEVDRVVDAYRKPRHRELIERAQHAEYLQNYLGKRVSEPPFAKPASERARITGIGTRNPESSSADSEAGSEPSGARDSRTLFPNKPKSHMRKSTQEFVAAAANAPDEVSTQRRRRRDRKA
jgi:hypothetical protein